MDLSEDDQTRGIYNNSNDEEFQDAYESAPLDKGKDGAFSNENDGMQLDEFNEDDIDATTFIKVTGKKKKRFRTTIKCIHIPGDSLNSKINNLYQVLANKKGFLECKRYFDRANKDAWITAIFDNQDAAVAATEMQLFNNNDFRLTLLKDRGDEEVQRRTLVVRDLPLDVNRRLLATILEAKFGKIENLKLRLAGPWYRADVIFEQAKGIEEKSSNEWSIQYKKDLCRIAPAYFTRENIEDRNQHTVKLTNLPFGTTPIDLKEILVKVNAKTCFIPRTRSRYNRKRFAYISFAKEEDLRRVMTNVRVMYNDTELFWEVEDAKTCHKCGSPKHLVAKCEERESAESYKEQQKQFSNIYSRYKVPNYKNANTKKYNNRFDQLKSNNSQNNATSSARSNNNNELQKMMENLLKSFTKDIEEKFNSITDQLADVNNRIKLLEIKSGLDKPKNQSNTNSNTSGKNKSPTYNMSYISTIAELEKSQQLDNEEVVDKGKAKQPLNSNTSSKRLLSESDQSSGDDKDKNNKPINKPRRKSLRLSKDEDKDIVNDRDIEIKNIKTTQQNLEQGVSELKEMFQQFTIQWFNSQSNNGNGSNENNSH